MKNLEYRISNQNNIPLDVVIRPTNQYAGTERYEQRPVNWVLFRF